ncbi:FAD-binding oxidoreductase [Leucobacter sp. UT-8R-CII-1-4]|uniref:FAD-binding oxidoreductase n=1 Tax=Leucobacter sp. UT-8R-CII-1-4 TaxID=3040075 RepID=UPI0024A7E0B4|nr:FAD-binding oxidoreductase [Leucobacter sp. UT-8R-CII-1-4]MDI6022984.1 FAD-binding oxidoreductase [Leucobacter sp. UT-8R-CII-1-4]
MSAKDASKDSTATANTVGAPINQPPTAPLRWNGWGDPALAKQLPLALRTLLPLKLGRIQKPAPATAIDKVAVAASALSAEDRAAFATVIGETHLGVDNESRLRHAGGRSTPDLLRKRASAQDTPDGVLSPATHEEVLALLRAAAERDIAVIPFGGGTSVVGALDPERGSHRAVVAIDLTRMSGLISLDEVSGQARMFAGTTGPEAERLLGQHGYELGHFPQSFLYATLGGFAAARSSGQNSSGNGRFDDMVLGMRVATPSGEFTFGVSPGSSVGPDLTKLFLGSEGIFGIITELVLRVHPQPATRSFEAWSFPDFETGAEALRQVAQLRTRPTVIRLSDEAETSVSLAQHGKIGKALSKGCSAVTVFEGDPADVAARHAATAEILKRVGASSEGSAPAESWINGRFGAPYLRDSLLDHGVFCETLETATTWTGLHTLKERVTAALQDGFAEHGAKAMVLCHVSHIYPSGAALYFTIAAGIPGDDLEVWAKVKASVNDTIVANGGTLSHHHGVGRDHAPWIKQEIGEAGVRILRAVKAELDPSGIMNPGAVIG